MEITLKQTVREKGRVTSTRAKERTVRAQPHTPMPVRDDDKCLTWMRAWDANE